MIDQRHLAENAALVESIEQAVAEPDFDCSAFDDKEFLAASPSLKMTSPALKLRTGLPALIKRSKSMFVSGILRLNVVTSIS